VAKKVGNLLKYLESVLHRAEVRRAAMPAGFAPLRDDGIDAC
jgi:hypothetical protein